MKKLTEYETPKTIAATFEVRGYPIPADVTFASFSGDLERKLAMCRDALAEVVRSYNGQLDCLSEVIVDLRETLLQTK